MPTHRGRWVSAQRHAELYDEFVALHEKQLYDLADWHWSEYKHWLSIKAIEDSSEVFSAFLNSRGWSIPEWDGNYPPLSHITGEAE